MTIPLGERAGNVIAVEIDDYLGRRLTARVPANVTVIRADFLSMQLPESRYKILGNLPFSRTTDMIRKITSAASPPTDAWLVVQREAAHRFIGAPYQGETAWSLQLKPWWHIEIIDRLRKQDFDPPPGVESVMMWSAQRQRPLLSDHEGQAWRDMTRALYQSGASVRQLTRRWLTRTQLTRLSRDLRFSADARAPGLTFEQWLGIFRFMYPPGRSPGL